MAKKRIKSNNVNKNKNKNVINIKINTERKSKSKSGGGRAGGSGSGGGSYGMIPPIIIQPHAPTIFPERRESTINPVHANTPPLITTTTSTGSNTSVHETPSRSIHHSDIYAPKSSKYYSRFDYNKPEPSGHSSHSSHSSGNVSFINTPSTFPSPVFDIDDDTLSTISSIDSANDHVRDFGTSMEHPMMRDAQTYVRVDGRKKLVGHTPRRGRPTVERQEELFENHMNDVLLTPTHHRHHHDYDNHSFASTQFLLSPNNDNFQL